MKCRGKDAWDKYREVIRVYRNEMRKAKFSSKAIWN